MLGVTLAHTSLMSAREASGHLAGLSAADGRCARGFMTTTPSSEYVVVNVTEQCGTHGLDAPQRVHVRAVFVLLDSHVIENPALEVGLTWICLLFCNWS